METRPQSMMEDEIDLRELFLVLWKGKWIIAALVVVAALAAAVGSKMLLTPTYEAVATLLIMPPTYQTSLEPEALPLQTYQALALTPSIAGQVIERLQLKSGKGEPLAAGDVLRAVEVDVLTQDTRSDSRQAAGIIRIKAAWSEPDIARDIANAWADVFIESTSQIRKSELDEVAQVILNQHGATERMLKDSEKRLIGLHASGSVSLANQQVEVLVDQLGEQRRYTLRTHSELDIKRNQLEALTNQLTAVEHEGEWLGFSLERLSGHDLNGIPARQQIIEAANQLVRARDTLVDFDNQSQMSLVEQELKSEQTQLSNYRSNLSKLKARLPEEKARYVALESRLLMEDEKLLMSRSLTTDALWNALGTDLGTVEKLAGLRLIDETVNPIYLQIAELLTEAKINLEAIPNQIKAYEEMIGISNNRLIDLESQLRTLQQERMVLEEQLNFSTRLYDSLKEQYLSMREKWMQLAGEVAMLELEVERGTEELGQQEAAVAIAENRLLELELEESELVRNIESLQRTHRVLSEQTESARLAELQATGDVRFVSEAVAPRSPSGPNHKMNVAVTVVLAGMIGVGAVFIINMFQTHPA
ncbi:MAG: hypothetical protein GX316_09830 [Firmicutes bacterium]|nr:hypothetical protein [Bacillota bacterium]